MHHLLSNTLAPRTSNQYNRCTTIYLSFCQKLDLQAFPIVEYNLMLYITFLSDHSSYSSIKIHLSAIKFHDIRHGYHTQLPPLARLYLLTRSIKRTQGSSRSKPKRQPITIEMLTLIYNFLLKSEFNTYDRQMLWTACTTAFFGFLRSSEYLSPSSTEFDESSTLLYDDIKPMKSTVHVTIKASKTDPFRHGCILRFCETNHPICPVKSLKDFCRIHLSKSGPRFMFSDGRFLTRRIFNDLLKRIYAPCKSNPISTHSFRIGAATTAAAAGIPSWLIKQLGRWNSTCFESYIRIPDSTIRQTSELLCRTKTIGHKVWNPDLN